MGASLVYEENLGSDLGSIVRFTGLNGCGNCVSVLVRASNQLLLDETERSIHDALCVVRSLVKKKALIPGGGALEICPYTLAENAGMNPIEIVTALRAAHAKGEKF